MNDTQNTMDIKIVEFIEGAKQAEGITVIIDVFRAFSVECYAFDAGAETIVATLTPEKAFELKKQYKRPILVGERNERIIPGFDFGNSPTEIINGNIKGKNIIHTTSAGTQGLLNATNAEMLLTASLVNCSAVAKYIKSLNPQKVTIVAMGYRGTRSTEEDLLCAEIIKLELLGISKDYSKEIYDLRNTSGKRFFNPKNVLFSPPSDFEMCINKDRFDFVIQGKRIDDQSVEMIRINL